MKVMSKNMARIIAKISGDGHLSKRQIMYFNTCSVLTEEFKKDIKETFGNVNFSEGLMSSGTPYVAVSCKHIVAELIYYPETGLHHESDLHSSQTSFGVL